MNSDERPQASTFVDPAARYQHTQGSGLASYPLSLPSQTSTFVEPVARYQQPSESTQVSTFVDPAARYQHISGSGLASYPLPLLSQTSTFVEPVARDQPTPESAQASTFADPAAHYQHTRGSGLASYPLSPQVTWTPTTRDGSYSMSPPIGSPMVGQPLAPAINSQNQRANVVRPSVYPSATVSSPVSMPIHGNATVDAVLAHQVSKSMLPTSARSETSQISKTLLIDSALPSY